MCCIFSLYDPTAIVSFHFHPVLSGFTTVQHVWSWTRPDSAAISGHIVYSLRMGHEVRFNHAIIQHSQEKQTGIMPGLVMHPLWGLGVSLSRDKSKLLTEICMAFETLQARAQRWPIRGGYFCGWTTVDIALLVELFHLTLSGFLTQYCGDRWRVEFWWCPGPTPFTFAGQLLACDVPYCRE